MQQYRYPGTRPFTADDRNLFFGRNDDITGLSNLISLENIVVLYGKSGLGKTSLLNAGVIPYLQENGDYETIQIRFGAHIPENSVTPIEVFNRNISNTAQKQNFIYDKIIPRNQITQHQLWYLFKELQIAKPENPCFIIVFDQFEELFTYPENQIEQFKKELSELLNVKIPQQVRNILKDKLLINKDYLTKDETALLYKSLNIKIVFSIRSDRMSFINRMTDYLPNILKKCYELQPLTEVQAISAITEPAKKQDDIFISKPYEYDSLALKEIINFLSKNGQQKIETFLLQILCQYTENIVIKNNLTSVVKSDLGDLQNISKNFYDSIISELPENERASARILLEEGLILEEEERRLSLYEGQIYKQFNISKELLQRLVNTHLLRSEPYHSGGFVYEISHDTLVAPVLAAKKIRVEEQRRLQLEKQKAEEIEQLQAKQEKELVEQKKKTKNLQIIISIVTVASFLSILLLIYSYRQKQLAQVSFLINTAYQNLAVNKTLAFRISEQALNIKEDINAKKIIYEAFYNGILYNQIYQSKNPVWSVNFSHDGKKIITTGDSVRIFDLDGKQLLTLKGHTGEIFYAEFSQDNKKIITAGADKTARVWDITGKQLLKIDFDSEVNSARFSPDGKYVLLAGDDPIAGLYDSKGELLIPYEMRSGFRYAQFAGDGQYFILTTKDDDIGIFSLNGDCIAEKRDVGKSSNDYYAKSDISYATFSPTSNSYLAINAEINYSEAFIFNISTDSVLTNFNQKVTPLSFAAYSPDGKLIATATKNNTIVIWSIEGKKLYELRGNGNTIKHIAISPDNQYVAATDADNSVKLWKLDDFTIVNETAKFVVVSPLGNSFLALNEDRTIVSQFDTDGKKLQTFKIDKQKIAATCFSPDEKNIVCAGSDNTVYIFDAKGNIQWNYKTDWAINYVLWRENQIFAALDSGKISIYNTATKKQTYFAGHEDFVNWIAVSNDGNSIATASADSTIIIRDAKGKTIRRFKAHDHMLTSVEFSPDGKYLVSAGWDFTTRIWNLADTADVKVMRNQKDLITGAKFLPDGRFIVAACWDNTILIYDLQGNEIAAYKGHTDKVNSIDLTPDGNYIISCSNDKTIKKIPFNYKEILRLVNEEKRFGKVWELDGESRKRFGM